MQSLGWPRLWAVFLVVSALLAGCWGDDDDGSTAVNAPAITTQPAAVTVAEGAAATFTVVASGDAELAYQWLRNGTAIGGATSASYTTPATVAADGGAVFTVKVSNGGGSVTSNGAALSVTPAVRGTLTGRVQSANDSAPIVGAKVTVAGVEVISGADGSFTLQAPVSQRAVARVEAAGFGTTVRIATVAQSQSTPLTVQLLPVAATQSVTIANGGDVTVPGSTALVRLPAGGLVRNDGGTAAAAVTVSVTPINPAIDASLMPGDFTAGAENALQTIESFGAINVDIRDAAGASYNLASGRTATLRIPLGTRSANPPATVPLFFFNESTGRWAQEGSATLQGTAPDQYYEGTVGHFSIWNADQVAETINLTGCVRDTANQPVVGATVSSDGIDYSGSSRAVTGADGSFVIQVKRAGVLTLAALAGDRLTNTLRVDETTTAANATLPNCLVTTLTTAGLNVKLTWGAKPTDVDSHLLTPDGDHVYFSDKGSLTSAPYASLDVDDTSGFGPEVVTLTRLMQGTYRYIVHNYSGTFDPGVTGSPARVELSRNGQLNVFTPPAGEGSNLWWHAFDLVVDANCAVTVVPVNAWSTQRPEPIVAPNPALCNAP